MASQNDQASSVQDATRAMQSLAAGLHALTSGNVLGTLSALAAGVRKISAMADLAGSAARGAAGAVAAPGAGMAAAAEASEALAAGLAEAAPPLLAVAGATALVVGGLKAVYDAAGQAADRLAAVGRAGITGGGSPGDVSALARFGLGPGEAAALGAQVRERVTAGGDPAAMQAAAALGLGPQAPQAFGGDQNNPALLSRALEALSRQSGSEQLRLARSLGLENELPRLNVSPEVRQARGREAGLEGRVNTQQATQAALALGEGSRLLGRSFDLLGTAAAKGAIKPITEGLLELGEAVGKLADTLNNHPEIAGELGKMVKFFLEAAAGFALAINNALPLLTKLGAGFVEFIDAVYTYLKTRVDDVEGFIKRIGGPTLPGLPDLPKHGVSGGLNDDALRKNTDALNDNTRWMRETVNGGGDRVRGAYPAGLRGKEVGDFLKTQRIALGAFSL